MDNATRISLVVILFIAAAIGLIAAHAQHVSVAAPPPTLAPTPIPPPSAYHIDIIPATGSAGQPAYFPRIFTGRLDHKITWLNSDAADHTVTSDSHAFDSGVLAPGQRFSWKPRKPGIYRYGSYLDGNLNGEIIIRP